MQVDDGEWKDKSITGISRTGSFSGVSSTGAFKSSISRTSSSSSTNSESVFSHIQSGGAKSRGGLERTERQAGIETGRRLSQVASQVFAEMSDLTKQEILLDNPLDVKNIPRTRVYQNAAKQVPPPLLLFFVSYDRCGWCIFMACTTYCLTHVFIARQE